MRTTKEVWDHHYIVFANADIESVMSDFPVNNLHYNT